jgi:DNA-binding response OmpR family regulator
VTDGPGASPPPDGEPEPEAAGQEGPTDAAGPEDPIESDRHRDGGSGDRLLVVEDEAHIAAGLKLNLELEGYRVELASTGREAGALLLSDPGFDAMILDVMLPDVSGFDLCRRLRDAGNYIPVVMLTARTRSADRVAGLEAGADDYLPKPFELEELLARVRSVLRRRRWEQREEPEAHRPTERVLRFGRALVDFETAEAQVDGRRIHLTRLERDLLEFFARHPSVVHTREELLAEVWHVGASTGRTVDNFISRLRRHFEEDPSNPRHFISVRGTGYKFVPEGAARGKGVLDRLSREP